jgi:hypothetical protein
MKSPLRTFLLLAFTVATTLIVAVAATLTVAMETALNGQVTLVEDKSTNLDNARWTIVEAIPVGGKFSLKLKSDIGNLKQINEVRSYAISNSGQQLAISAAGGIQIVRLADSSAVEIAIPFAYTGDVGKAFSWSYDDSHIAVIVAELADANKKHLLTFSRDGELELNIERNFASQNGSLLAPKFSPNGKYILTTIDDRDLVIFDRQGNPIASIATAKQPGKNLFYFWDAENGINYAVINSSQEVNFADETMFTRVQLQP